MQSPPNPPNEQQRLAALRTLRILDTPPEERFDRITRTAQRLFDVPIALVSLVDENRQWFKSCYGLPVSETPRDVSFCGHAILSTELLVIENATQDARFADNPLVTGGPAIRFYAGCPLRGPGNVMLGTLCIISPAPRRFTAADRQTLRDLGAWAENELSNMAVVELGRAQQELTASEERLKLVLEGSNDGFYDWDIASGAMDHSGRFAMMLGYQPEELEPRVSLWERLLHPDDRPAVIERLNDHLEGRSAAFIAEYRLRTRSGAWQWVLDRGKVVTRDAQGNALRMTGTHTDISARKRAEQALLDTLVLQRAILDSANFTIISTDTQGVILTFNAGAQRMLGYAEDDVVGKLTPAVLHDPDEIGQRAQALSRELGETIAPGFDVFVAKAARFDVPDENEWTYIRKDGSRFPVLLSITALRDAGGIISGYLGIGHDLTESKRAQEVREAQQQLLDILFRATSRFVASSDADVTFDYLLTRLLRLTGSECGFIGEVLYQDGTPCMRTHAISNLAWSHETQCFHAGNAQEGKELRDLNNLLAQAMDAGAAVFSNDQAHDPQDHQPMNAAMVIPIYYGDKLVGLYGMMNRSGGYDTRLAEFLQPFTSTCSMLIDALRSERVRATTLDALRESEGRVRAILDNVLEGIITIDEQGIVESFNAAAEDIFGYAAEEVVGHSVNMLIPEPHASAHDQYLKNYLTTGIAKVIGVAREVTGRRKNGSVFPMELAVSEIPLANTRIFTGIARDITERKKLERMKNEFISTVSHELRTPLTSIRGSLGLIAGGAVGAVPEQARALIDIACNNSDRLVRLINDILDVEKIESGKMSFRIETVDIMALVDQAIEATRAFGQQYGVRYAVIERLPGVSVDADADRLTQVVTNLLSNAAKFSPANGQVDIALRLINDHVRISVTDRGAGIPEAFQTQIFQKFAQADASDTRQKSGTGLGLSISRAIVERHGGRIGFTTGAEGTTFYFDLYPRAQQGAGAASAAPANDMAQRPTILICEDDPDVARLLAIMLEQGGYATDIAYDAAQAKQRLCDRRYVAMTLDIMLPGQDGISLIRELRQDAKLRELPIVVVSAKSEQGRMELSGDAIAVVDWLTKPIDTVRLLAAVSQAALRSRGEQARILYVEDDADIVRVVRTLLQGKADLICAGSLAAARQVLTQRARDIDLVILDIGLPDGSGLDLLAELQRPDGMPLPVIVFSAQEVGDEISKRVSLALVKSRVSSQALLDAINALIGAPANPAPGR
jgi:PAS domain S-box-containing protein